MTVPETPEGETPKGRCPICGKPRDPRFRPFCSRTCRDRDFMAWADGRYAVPAVEQTDDEDVEPPPPPPAKRR